MARNTSYATHVLQQLERGESPVPAEGIGLACRAGKKFRMDQLAGRHDSVRRYGNTSRFATFHNRKRCLKQIVTKCEQLPFHKENAQVVPYALSVMSAMPMPAMKKGNAAASATFAALQK